MPMRGEPGLSRSPRCDSSWLPRSALGNDASLNDRVQLREIPCKVRVALAEEAARIRTISPGRTIAIAFVQTVHHSHPLDHLAKRCKARVIQSPVHAVIDENL